MHYQVFQLVANIDEDMKNLIDIFSKTWNVKMVFQLH